MEIRKFRNHISMVFEQIWSFLLVIALLKLYEQYKIIYREIESLSKKSQDIIEKALGEICDIEMIWGWLCSIDIAEYNNTINKKQAIELIEYAESHVESKHIKEMKKDLKFIYEGENE